MLEAKQESEAKPLLMRGKVETVVWTDRMLAALVSGVKGGKSESIRKMQANPKKIYVIDTGLIRAMTLDHTKDVGRLFENLIYLDLRRQGFIVNYYLTKERYEVDFLVQSTSGKKGICSGDMG